MTLLVFKAHNAGYTRKDGAYVAPFDDKRMAKVKAASLAKLKLKHQMAQLNLFPDAKSVKQAFGQKLTAPQYGIGKVKQPKAYHQQKNDNGQAVPLHKPSQPSDPATWGDHEAIATFVPGGDAPHALNGVALKPWKAPTTTEGWAKVPGQMPGLKEPEIPEVQEHQHLAAGVVVEEPDGRIWTISPSNGFGGYANTFPKGTAEAGLTLQQTALKEAIEESGLQVEITGFLADVQRSTSVCRFYRAKRVGGTPTAAGWESQAVNLVPVDLLDKHADSKYDKQVIAALKERAS